MASSFSAVWQASTVISLSMFGSSVLTYDFDGELLNYLRAYRLEYRYSSGPYNLFVIGYLFFLGGIFQICC